MQLSVDKKLNPKGHIWRQLHRCDAFYDYKAAAWRTVFSQLLRPVCFPPWLFLADGRTYPIVFTTKRGSGRDNTYRTPFYYSAEFNHTAYISHREIVQYGLNSLWHIVGKLPVAGVVPPVRKKPLSRLVDTSSNPIRVEEKASDGDSCSSFSVDQFTRKKLMQSSNNDLFNIIGDGRNNSFIIGRSVKNLFSLSLLKAGIKIHALERIFKRLEVLKNFQIWIFEKSSVLAQEILFADAVKMPFARDHWLFESKKFSFLKNGNPVSMNRNNVNIINKYPALEMADAREKKVDISAIQINSEVVESLRSRVTSQERVDVACVEESRQQQELAIKIQQRLAASVDNQQQQLTEIKCMLQDLHQKTLTKSLPKKPGVRPPSFFSPR